MSYVYIRSEPRLWTVGTYRPDGGWEPASDHGTETEAQRRAAWLNGSQGNEDCECPRWTAAIARVATLQSIDIDMNRHDEVTAQIAAHEKRGDTITTVFYAGVQLGILAAKEALREVSDAG